MVRDFWSGLPSFYKGLFEALEDPSMNPKKLMHIDHYGKFLCSNFQRFLNRVDDLGFERVNNSKHLEFGHKKYFVRGRPELLKKWIHIVVDRRRRKTIKALKAKKEVEEGLENLQI